MLEIIVENIVRLIVIAFIVFILYKLDILRFIVAKSSLKSNKRVKVSYKRLLGSERYTFTFKKQQSYTMQYVVSVEEESLQVIFKDRNTIFFNETFTENTEGTFTFTSANRRHELRFIGKKSRGRCQIEFIKNNSAAAA